jgi:hypothetical protein
MKAWFLAAGVTAALAAFVPQAEARGVIGIGINVGVPICPRPYWGGYYYPYYRPYPVYVAPAPVYVAPPPVYVEQPVLVRPAPVPVVQPSGAPQVVKAGDGQAQRLIPQLFDQQETVRSEAALELGRMRNQQAVDPLITLVSTDRSPLVREAAARALGLIGSEKGLTALQNAAQGDNDRDVRRSAQFAAEVIQTNLRR